MSRIVALALVALSLAGCLRTGPHLADKWWHDNRRPVPVEIDRTMPQACIEAAYEGVDVWRDAGVDFLRPVLVPRVTDYALQNPRTGAIVVTYRESMGTVFNVFPNQVGGTNVRGVMSRMRGAGVLVSTCAAVVFAHEIGRALGLRGRPRNSPWLMSVNAGGRPGVLRKISPDEIRWVTQ